jgi:hypothetical protein
MIMIKTKYKSSTLEITIAAVVIATMLTFGSKGGHSSPGHGRPGGS